MILFSGTSNKPLAEKIAKHLHLDVSPVEFHTFPDGELRVKLDVDVVDQDCIIVQPTSTPVDANYVELFFLADACKSNGAKSVTAVIPYLGYQRQDHIFRIGESASLHVMVKSMEAVGIDRVVVCDLHSIKIPEFFHIPLTHVSALPLFAEEIKKLNLLENSVLVTPDMGGIRRIKILSELLGNLPYASIEKNRDLKTGEIEASNIEGKLAKRAFIVDDMISSGKTIAIAAELLEKNGVEEVYVFVTHAIFSKEAPQILQNSKAIKIFVTDSVVVPKEKEFEKLSIVSISDIIAKELTSNP